MAQRGRRPAPAPSSATIEQGARVELGEIQRSRIIAAATEVVAELGYGGLTVAEIIARARISRRTFYELFADREECFLAAFDAALARVAEPVLAAYAESGPWRERIAAALLAALASFDEEPALARLLLVDALAAGPLAVARRAAVIEALVHAVDEGRAANARGRDPGPLAAEGVVGAVLSVLHTRLLDERRRPKSLLILAAPLMSTIVLPYLGAAAAARELERPVASLASGGRANGSAPTNSQANPLYGLDMRLTYRTLRVLSAVGAHPGASNRAVAEEAGIGDQGQISKLLARLQNLGLIENHQAGRANGSPFRGEPNRWRLTPRGAEVVEAVRARPVLVR